MQEILRQIARSSIKRFPPLYRQVNRLRGWRIHDPDTSIRYMHVGGNKGVHNYGAWVVPVGLLHAESVVYSFGVGEDISFDKEIIEKFGCKVYAFDPTPSAAMFVARYGPDPRFVFEEIGLGSLDGFACFSAPKKGDPSYSKVITSNAEENVHKFPVRRLSTIMKNNNHLEIDLLKMDIEGFEYEVIDDLISSKLFPSYILLEFHHFQRRDANATRASVSKLRDCGYGIFWVSDLGAEYGLCRL